MDPFLSLATARRILREHQSGLHDHSRKLWTMLVLAGWNGRHYDNRSSVANEVISNGESRLAPFSDATRSTGVLYTSDGFGEKQ